MLRWISFLLRYSWILILLVSRTSPHAYSPSSMPQGLHPMPPHPALVEQLQREGQSLPFQADRFGRGIDRPQHVAVPPTGNFNLLVVAVDFSDKAGTVNPTFFDSLVFTPAGPSVNSVTDYYDEISHSTLTLVTVNLPGSLGWIRAPGTYNGPGGYVNPDGSSNSADDYGWGPYPQNLQGIVWNVIPLIDPLVDFSQYDNDGDGFVDSITFVHAGPGAEITGSPNDIWSSAWNLSDGQGPGPLYTLEGVMVDGFSFEAEYMYTVSSATSDQTIGMFCHELGHALFGLPDLYDPDYTSNGVGMWSLMSYGAWNGNGTAYDGSSPAWPDAWSRTVMGFEQPMEITSNLYSYPISPVETSPGAVFKLWSPKLGAREYFLVENRQLVGYDTQLPGQGLLIWHVDEDKWNLWEANTYECTLFPQPGCSCPAWHYLVSLEQADGQFHLENTTTNFGDANDPYPWPYQQNPIPPPNNQNFEFTSTPESGSWYANPCVSNSCVAVKNISIFFPGPPDTLMADFEVICGSGSSCINILPAPVVWDDAGATASHIVSLQNCGPYDLFGLSVSSQWPSTIYNPTNGQPITDLPISSGSTAQVGVHVNLPESAGPGDGNLATLTVTPQWLPGTSVIATLTTQVPTCVLLVDDDRKQPDVEDPYLTALLQNRFAFDYWDVFSQGIPDANTLSAHQSVVWFTGASQVDTLHIRDEMVLMNYLDSSGQLFLSSQDYLSDAGRTFFNRAYLGVGMYLTDLGATSVKGVTGTPIWQNLGPYLLTPPAPSSDRFNPIPGAQGAFENENGYTNALVYNSGTWRSLFLAWPFEYLGLPDAEVVMSTAMNWLEILPRPTVSFTVSAPIACTGNVVTFTNTSTGGDRWWWDFGDGSTSTLTDTTHTYQYPFTATVTLKGMNCCGYETNTQSIEILPAPQVSFTMSSPTARVGETVIFTGTFANLTHLLWDFGDGATSSLPNPTHIYTIPLTATVVLKGFNDCGVATAQRVLRIDAGQTFVYLPLAMKNTGGGQPIRQEDWALVVLPVTVGMMLFGKKSRR
jgi:M6 family metalloprotease-like protein